MEFEEFRQGMDKLHRSFDALPYSGKELEFYASKVIEWFNLWKRWCRGSDKAMLDIVVIKTIETYDRRPSFAQLKSIRDELLRSTPKEARPKSTCDCDCGIVLATKFYQDYGKARYAFRCQRCENWFGHGDGLPPWGEDKMEKGYEKIDLTNGKQLCI